MNDVLILEEAETKIRIILRDYFLINNKLHLDIKVRKVIKEAVKNINVSGLKTVAIMSLWNFYNRQYQTYQANRESVLIYACLLALQGKPSPIDKSQARSELELRGAGYGVPTQKFAQDYFKNEVKPVYERLIQQNPIDPDDISGRNTLRNRAEMEVRYNAHLQQIADLQQKTRLVIASTHADCSERCSKWQGKVYSLDHSYGTTDDGRKYVPLEVATDVFYTTKKGKTYKNGLLGFNCRHYLVPYQSGFKFPKPTNEKHERFVTEKQRAMERDVRKWRDIALQYKGTPAYQKAHEKAINANKAYIEYSKKNGRAYYPSRTQIL